jgi:hypothetical protein
MVRPNVPKDHQREPEVTGYGEKIRPSWLGGSGFARSFSENGCTLCRGTDKI